MVAATERPLLLLAITTPECDQICTALRTHGWTVEHVAEPEAAAERVRSGDYQAGVVVVHTESELASVKRVCVDPGAPLMEWVALVTQAAIRAPDVQEFVSTRCFDYHTLPLDAERLEPTLGHAHGMAALARSVRGDAGPVPVHGDELLVSESAVMKGVLRTVEKFAASELPVLIGGESGTGKEQAALTLHARSRRADAPFVAVNCAALTPSLMQSELFGHEKGAFTGAHRRRIGRIESARGGTILLDEVGDLPGEVQVSLLRFLEEHTIERVGASEPITVDVRVIAATHVDLHAAVASGRFREDLFHRLSVLTMDLPPLRERPEDLAVLAHHFLAQQPGEPGARPRGFTAGAMRALKQHDWPGNVRELLNRVSQAAVLCEGRYITRACLRLERRRRPRHVETLKDARDAAERRAILKSIDWAGGNMSRAAEALGVSRSYLYTLMKRYGLEADRES